MSGGGGGGSRFLQWHCTREIHLHAALERGVGYYFEGEPVVAGWVELRRNPTVPRNTSDAPRLKRGGQPLCITIAAGSLTLIYGAT